MTIKIHNTLQTYQVKIWACFVHVVFVLSHQQEELWSRYLEYLIKHEEGKPFREVLQSNSGVEKLINMAGAVSSMPDIPLGKYSLKMHFKCVLLIEMC